MNIIIRFFVFSFAVFFAWNSVQAAEWYRGNTHAHSWQSDANVAPEEAVHWYKTHGYQFLALTDHTSLQTEKDRWRFSEEAEIKHIMELFGSDWVETRIEGNGTQMRLKTVDELQQKFNEPGKFLLVSGHEQNSSAGGRTLHTIAFNVTETIPFRDGESASEAIRENHWAIKRHGADANRSTLMIVNHPAWPFYDIPPHSLIHAPQVQFFEFLCANGGVSANYVSMDDKFWEREKYWDIVNAFRTISGEQLIYGVGADDTHDYINFGDRKDNPGESYIVVRANELKADTLVGAMRKGDFYISTGVELADIRFDEDSKTLNVSVKPVDGVKYKIEFVGTKKNFDRTVETFTMDQDERNPAQKGYKYAIETIGTVLKTVDGTEASYTMTEDDLYVRAIITSDKPNPIQAGYEPATDSAWTQPYRQNVFIIALESTLWCALEHITNLGSLSPSMGQKGAISWFIS